MSIHQSRGRDWVRNISLTQAPSPNLLGRTPIPEIEAASQQVINDKEPPLLTERTNFKAVILASEWQAVFVLVYGKRSHENRGSLIENAYERIINLKEAPIRLVGRLVLELLR